MIKDEVNVCDCDKCECPKQDDYTREGGTCEECFSGCQPTEGGDECDCTEVCGWTKPHYVTEGSCPNCGTNVSLGEESIIEFDCETHGEIIWFK